MLRLFLPLFFAASAQAQYTVRIVTISAPELPAVRAAMLCAPGDDGSLRRELLPYFAEPVSDLMLRCGPGRSKLEGRVETPYATEFDPPVAPGQQTLPSAFATKNVGTSAEVMVEPGVDGKPPVLSVTWDRIRDAGRTSFPLLTSPSAQPIVQPRFLLDRIAASIAIVSGQWRLLGMTRPLETDSAPAGPPRALLTFVQAWDHSSAKPAAVPAAENRLHFLTFRLPAAEGMKLATRPAGTDATLFDNLLQRAEHGGVLLTSHAACVLTPDARTERRRVEERRRIPGDPFAPADPLMPPAGPFVPAIKTSACASLMEFPYATEYDPDPSAFSAKNIGRQLTLYGASLEWAHQSEQVQMIPLSPQPEAAAARFPEFTAGSLKLHASLPRGAVLLAGASLLPDDGHPRMMDVHFLKCAGASSAPIPGSREVHVATYSLPPAEAVGLSTLHEDQQCAALDSLLASGTARLLAWQAVAGTAGHSASVNHLIETPSADEEKVLRYGVLLMPAGSGVYSLGSRLELNLQEGGAGAAGKFSVNLDRPRLPSLEEFENAARDDKPLAEYVAATLEHSLQGAPRLVLFPPQNLPENHPEHGRRHVALILRRDE